MAESNIEWTGHTWNPILGCSVVSPGCTNCYAMKMAARLERMGQDRYTGLTKPSRAGAVWTGEMRLVEDALTLPLRRKKPTTYFVNSMSDLFHKNVPDAWIDRVFAVMALAPQHTFQVLTKRSERMRAYFAGCENPPDKLPLGKPWVTQWSRREHIATAMEDVAGRRFADRLGRVKQLPLPNVWLGVSAEDQTRADARVPDLLATPAAIRFVSAEPLLGPIDFTRILISEEACEALHPRWEGVKRVRFLVDALAGSESLKWSALDWIIAGGENGPRPMHPQWARDIRDPCAAAGVPFFFKQWGTWAPSRLGAGIARASSEERVWRDGEWAGHAISSASASAPDTMNRVGKKAAGRLLDGVEHNGMPLPTPTESEASRER